MAKVLKGDLKRVNRAAARYPWDEWFDGKTRELTKPADFTCNVINFRSQVYVAAKRLGFTSVSVSVIDDNTVHIQARPK